MLTSAAERGFDPEVAAAIDVLEVLKAQKGNPEMLMAIVQLLGNPTNTLNDFLRELLDKLNGLIPSDSSHIALVVSDSDGGRSKVVVRERGPDGDQLGAMAGKHDAPPTEYFIGGEELPPDQRSLTGYSAYLKKAIIVPNVQQWKETTGFYQQTQEATKSEIAVPILFEDQDVLAVINLESEQEGYYKEEHQYQLQWVAGLISRVLYSFLNREGYLKPYLTVLGQIHRELSDLRVNTDLSLGVRKYLSEDSKQVLDAVARKIATALGSEICAVWILTKDQGELILEGQYGLEKMDENATTRFFELAEQAKKQSELLNIDGSFSPNGEPFLIAPLLVGERAYGAVMVMSPGNGRSPRYRSVDERLLNVLQQPVGVAIHQKHFEWERRASVFRRGEDVAALLDIFEGVDLDVDALLQRACSKIEQHCLARHCSIFVLDETTGGLVRRASSVLPEGYIDKPFYMPGEGLTGWVAEHGRPLNIRTRRDEDLEHLRPRVNWRNKEKEQCKELIDRPYIAVPVRLHGKTVGVIRCTDKIGPRAVFTEGDEQVLALIAAYIATAIAFKMRYQIEISLLNNIKPVLSVFNGEHGKSLFEETLLNRILAAAASIFEADLAVAYRYRNGALQPDAFSHGVLIYEHYLGSNLNDESLVFNMLDSDEGVRCFPDADDNIEMTRSRRLKPGEMDTGRFVVREQIKSVVAARVDFGVDSKVVLFLNYRKRSRTFDQQFLASLRVFTDIASLCLQVSEVERGSMEVAAHLNNIVIPELVREVISEAGFGTIRCREKDYHRASEHFETIEESGQVCVAALSDAVRRLIAHFSVIPSPV